MHVGTVRPGGGKPGKPRVGGDQALGPTDTHDTGPATEGWRARNSDDLRYSHDFVEAGETHNVRTCGAVSMIFATSVLVFIKPCSRNLFLCSTHLHTWCNGARFSRGPYGGVIKFDPTMRQRAFGKPRNEFQLSSVKEQMLICHCSLFF